MNNVLRLLDRALFTTGTPEGPGRLLGLVVLGLVALGLWLIFWPFVPPLISRFILAMLDLISAIWQAIPPLSWPEWLRWPGR
ncbi:MAG TPA: hypothetical protein VEQ11_00880 [Chloroflexota bacterium]|nr:hypothetical protein [Chloroflexota bacterium]